MSREHAAAGGTVLVVEDHDDTRELVLEAVRWGGMYGVGARSVPMALRLMQGVGVHAVVTDYAMPDVDGLAFVELLRRDPRYARIPIVMISGQASEDVRSAVVALGAKYLAKPVDFDVLVATLRGALAESTVA